MEQFVSKLIFAKPKLIAILFLIFLVGFWIGKNSNNQISEKAKNTTNREDVDQVHKNTQEKEVTEQA